jgi:hypothetical protein
MIVKNTEETKSLQVMYIIYLFSDYKHKLTEGCFTTDISSESNFCPNIKYKIKVDNDKICLLLSICYSTSAEY